MHYSCLLLMFIIIYNKVLKISAIEYDISKEKSLNQSNIVKGYEPIYATDGNLNTYFKVSYLYDSTNLFDGTWITVDLIGLYNITKVYLWTTDDNDFYYARNIRVFVKASIYSRNDVNFELARMVNDSYFNPPKASKIIFYISEGIFGSFVWIGKDIQFKSDFIYLSEIVVIADTLDIRINNIFAISQSNELNLDYEATRAFDGNINTCIFIRTNFDFKVKLIWLEIDLGELMYIYGLRIYDINLADQYSYIYSIYISNMSFFNIDYNTSNLCFTYNQSNTDTYNFYKIKCNTYSAGRYIIFKKINGNRNDSLVFCEIEIFSKHNATNQTINFLTNSPETLPQPFSFTQATNETTNFITNSSETSPQLISILQDSNKIIVGCVIGLVIALILSIIFCIVYKKHKSNSKKKKVPTATLR